MEFALLFSLNLIPNKYKVIKEVKLGLIQIIDIIKYVKLDKMHL